MRWILKRLLFAAILSVLAAEPLFAADRSFISVSDIHFDPFQVCEDQPAPCPALTELEKADVTQWKAIFANHTEPAIQSGEDSGFNLLESSLQKIHNKAEEIHAEFALIPGDFLAHEFHEKYIHYSGSTSSRKYQAFVKKTLQFMRDEIHAALPDISIYPLIGNNDSYTGDYQVVTDGLFLQDTQNTWATLLQDSAEKKALLTTFAEAGYYALTPAQWPMLRIIALDTVLFSTRGTGPDLDASSLEQLAWLHDELLDAKVKGQRVLLVYHIPPGVDLLASLAAARPMPFWKLKYSRLFEQEVHQFQDNIVAVLPGHIHIDSLRFLFLKTTGPVPVYVTPSISPIFGNNPSFKIFYFDPENFQIKKTATVVYDMDKSTWHE